MGFLEQDPFDMHRKAANLQPPRRRLILVVVAFLALITSNDGPGADACSLPAGWRPPTTVERVLDAAVVLYGRVRTVYPDERFSHGSQTTVYTANVEVYCVMKGARTEQFLNISEAGL